MNAHRIHRTGLARASGPHLIAANEPFPSEDDEADDELLPCPECDGTGLRGGAPCSNCEGFGALSSTGVPCSPHGDD
jgi:hypothetical protein